MFKQAKALLALSTLSVSMGTAMAATEEGKLVLWVEPDKAYEGMGEVGKWFEEDTGIAVEVAHPDDLGNKFPQAASVGQGPDILLWAHDRFGSWVKSGLFEEVNPSKEFVQSVEPYTLAALKVNGKQYGYPLSVEAVSLIYNKKLVPTPPESFEEVFELDKKLKGDGKSAIIWDYDNVYFSWGLYQGQGAYVFGQGASGFDTSDLGVNSPGAIEAGNLIRKLVTDNVMPAGADYGVMESEFVAGNVAMIINGPWGWNNYRDKVDFGVTMIPSWKGKPSRPFVGIKGYGISTASSNKDLAIEFIENYLLSEKGLKILNDDVPLGVPANKAFARELGSNPLLAASAQSANVGVAMPNDPAMGAFWAAMESAFENISSGRQSAKEALDAAAERIKTSLEN